MGSPFPGMDPYLEGEMWQEFHDTLASEIRSQLLPQLAPKYVALLAKRYVLDNPLSIFNLPHQPRTFYPDVHVVHVPHKLSEPGVIYEAAPVATPTIELSSPIPEPVPVLTVEIRDVAKRRLVTVIEILSPVNKRGEGWQEYLLKRQELLRTETHLLEIDLLRQGRRIFQEPLLPPAPYFAFLSRTERRPHTAVFALLLRDPLPVLPVPLLHPDPDVRLDLQTAVQACFSLVGYERLLDYTTSPPPPDFDAEDAAWVTERLKTITEL